ncbi:sphingolipid long chain base-responsive protein PIL1 [Ascosphaera apis ARSEF 7405]|uniref:Sphingolipid long chain base-responsive protein PIL1 n=1 Tax=Ascosphaera apis ARSEF 7405 TaxID=392613 RepID=A0A162IP34_9EURO|nr:sphingolipid long chain base-responsive protein PIL1 [Ascosphaera apis ARSEF 7405]
MREQAEKEALIASYAKHLLELIDDNPITPGETRTAYDGYEASKALIQDCENALTHWAPSSAAVKPSLSIRTRHLSQRKRQSREQPIDEDGVDDVDFTQHERPMSMQSSSPATSSTPGSRDSWRLPSRSRQYRDQPSRFQRDQEDREFDSDDSDEHGEDSRPATAPEYNQEHFEHEAPEEHHLQHHEQGEGREYEPETDPEDENEPQGTEQTSDPRASHPSGRVDDSTTSQAQQSTSMAPAAAALVAPATVTPAVAAT